MFKQSLLLASVLLLPAEHLTQQCRRCGFPQGHQPPRRRLPGSLVAELLDEGVDALLGSLLGKRAAHEGQQRSQDNSQDESLG